MMYNNLIYFLVVIFVFSTNVPEAEPPFSPLVFVGVALLVLYLYSRVAIRQYRRVGLSAAQYFTAEKRLSILAVVIFVAMVYGLDLKHYFQPLSLGDRLPVLENLGGLAVFLLLLSVMWQKARPAYERLFNRRYRGAAFILSNLKANLPIVLPWLALSLAFDLLALLPLQWVEDVLLTPWGDLLLFLLFVCFLVFFFPPLVRRLWGCKPMPDGGLRQRIEAFCHRQGFHSEILLWPLFEGQVLTAGIMGILPKFRYLLVTPALLATMNREELESVLAHEIGHVKRLHLILYLLLFLGFSLLAGALTEPLHHILLSSSLFYGLLDRTNLLPETLLGLLYAVPLLILMLVYFRFVFGFFIRNFERQADLYVFRVLGTSNPLISAFEKISDLSGNIREQKNWHHFGIGERIEYLERSERDRRLIDRHDRKVRWALVLYFICVVATVFGLHRMDLTALAQTAESRYAEAMFRKTEARLMQQVTADPENSLWYLLLGNLLQGREMEMRAIAAYDKALELSPSNAEVNNNLAWLLLTAKDVTLRDPQRALTLARTAVLLREEGDFLDTLAEAYWANGLVEEALLMETRAMRRDPAKQNYYRRQMKKFTETRWGEER